MFVSGGNGNPGNPFDVVGDPVFTMEEAFNSRNVAGGVENIFINGGAYDKEVERVDYVYGGGITINSSENQSPDEYGFAFFERDANNNFGIAAITELDDDGNVIGLGDLVMFGQNGDPDTVDVGDDLNWGNANLTGFDDTARLNGTISNPTQSLDNVIGNQDIGGILITFQDLGIGDGETIFGYALFGGDQDNKNGGNLPSNTADSDNDGILDINEFANDTFYEQSTNATNGGGDLYGGGIIFEKVGSGSTTTILDPEGFVWDRNGNGEGSVDDSSVGAENADLTGVWSNNASDTNWGSAAGNIATNDWADNKQARFAAGTDASGNTYTVTVDGTDGVVKANALIFEEGTVTIDATNGGGIELNEVSNVNPFIDVQDGKTIVIEAPISGTDGFEFFDSVDDGGTLTLEGDNTISGTANVQEGTLELASTGGNQALGGIDTIEMNGGTLLLSKSDQINDTADIVFNGGNMTVNDVAGHEETLGTITLSADATIDFGSGDSIIRFDESNDLTTSIDWDGTSYLYLTNWSGNQVVGGGTDQIYFGTGLDGLSESQIAQIVFVDPFGPGSGIYPGILLEDGEFVPIPEPGTIAAGILLIGVGCVWEYHRRRRSVSGSAASDSRGPLFS